MQICGSLLDLCTYVRSYVLGMQNLEKIIRREKRTGMTKIEKRKKRLKKG